MKITNLIQAIHLSKLLKKIILRKIKKNSQIKASHKSNKKATNITTWFKNIPKQKALTKLNWIN
jgi:hypothetical protein